MCCPGPIDSADSFFGSFGTVVLFPFACTVYSPCPCAGGAFRCTLWCCRVGVVAILLQPRCKSGEGGFMCVVFPICICGAERSFVYAEPPMLVSGRRPLPSLPVRRVVSSRAACCASRAREK